MTSTLKWRIAILLVIVFATGLATGFFGGVWHARHAFAGRHGGHFNERMQEHLKRRLDLTPEQSTKLEPILERMSKQLEQIRTETGRRVAETMSESHREMIPFLTPAQQAELEKMKARHRHILRMHGGHPPPPPPDEGSTDDPPDGG